MVMTHVNFKYARNIPYRTYILYSQTYSQDFATRYTVVANKYYCSLFITYSLPTNLNILSHHIRLFTPTVQYCNDWVKPGGSSTIPM